MKNIWGELREEGYRLSTVQGWDDIESKPPMLHLRRRIGVLSSEEEGESILSKLDPHMVIDMWRLVIQSDLTLALEVHWTEELHRDDVHLQVSRMPVSERLRYIERRME